MTEPVTTIAVICNDSGHARGKVNKIVTFNREQLLLDKRPHWYRDITPLIRAAQRGHLPPPAPWAGHRYECNLCGLQLTCGDKLLQEMLDTLAAAGIANTTLKALIRVASTRR